jgi:hypothetical protein
VSEPTAPHFDTLEEAKQWLRDRVDKGARCPCCGQHAWVQKRRVNAGMARKLILANHRYGLEWFYMPEFLASISTHGRDEAIMRHWGLIQEAKERRDDGGRAGWWQVTERGQQFVHREITIPRWARVYDNRLLGYLGEQVDILDALKAKFDYSLLMQGIA